MSKDRKDIPTKSGILN